VNAARTIRRNDVSEEEFKRMAYRINGSEIIGDCIDGEIILLNLRAGTYYGLDNTAATLWLWLQEGASTEMVVNALQLAYPELPAQKLRGDLESWLGELTEHGILLPDDESGVGNSAAGPLFQGDYQVPRLVAHMDMQELLQLDPVHEAGEQGWPTIPAR
jgi:hypothetical protein